MRHGKKLETCEEKLQEPSSVLPNDACSSLTNQMQYLFVGFVCLRKQVQLDENKTLAKYQ